MEKPKLKLTELSHVLEEANVVNKGGGENAAIPEVEEQEEDTQIQSSLPFYLDHIFGSRVGFSQNELQVATSVSHEAPPLSCGVHSDSQVVLVMESQMSLLRTDVVSMSAGSICGPVPSHPPAVGCGSQPLFLSPCDGGSGERDAAGSEIGEFPSLNDMQQPSKCWPVQHAVANDVKKRKRNCSKAASGIKDGYYCPPSCTPFVECTANDRTVNLLVLVIQGWLQYSPNLSCIYGNNFMQ